MIMIKRGLDVPIAGAPAQQVGNSPKVRSVAIVGADYPGLKPTMKVAEGDRVVRGQPLFADKKNLDVFFTAPATGRVRAINRGPKRVFLSLVIDIEEGSNDAIEFKSYDRSGLAALSDVEVEAQLATSGLWTALRTRPFSKVPAFGSRPVAIFINAMDTNPLAANPEPIIQQNQQAFVDGVTVLTNLSGTVYVCKTPEAQFDAGPATVETFSGPHPAGLVGTHIHFLDPVSRKKTVWHINAQDVALIGSLFTSGKINVDRTIAICGPSAKNPRLIKTRVGASIKELTEGEIMDGETRIISGSVLSGRQAAGAEAYLGRFHQQITILEEGRKREFLGWLSAGSNLYSVKNIVISKLFRNKKFDFNTSTNGGPRAIVPIGSYEKIMPLDLVPSYLLRSLAVDDVEDAEALGILELDEEDLALCTYVCPSKIDHGTNLRRNLTLIEKEG